MRCSPSSSNTRDRPDPLVNLLELERAIRIQRAYTVDSNLAADGGPIAVIDLGSNSGRLVVYEVNASGHLEILEDARVPLRLAHSLAQTGALSEAAFDRTVQALEEFGAIAHGAGAQRQIIVATSAIRDASNGLELIQVIRDRLHVDVEVIDGMAEARYALLGAIHSLPVNDGMVLDIGGGSLELSRFKNRRGVGSWTLPIGALRMAGQFFLSDPPSNKEIKRLKRYLMEEIASADIGTLSSDEALVGTGGTIRNLAKIDRRTRSYPIPRLHGYTVTAERIAEITRRLSIRDTSARAGIPGLNPDRADSIVAGALAVQTVIEILGSTELHVSGQGLREGIAFASLGTEPLPAREVRKASVDALTSRFNSWDGGRAKRRRTLVIKLIDALMPEASEQIRESLIHAATVLDIGRSIDYYNRLSHTATIVIVADLGGFTHRGIAMLAAIINEADRRQSDLGRYEPLLGNDDQEMIARCGVTLLIADELERRYPNNAAITAQCRIRAGETDVTLIVPPVSDYVGSAIAGRFARAFGRKLVFESEGT